MKPTEELPGVDEVGDRVLVIVVEHPLNRSPMAPRLVILAAGKDGWYSPDPVYEGYAPADGILWAWEDDVCGIARVACPESCGGER